MDKRTIQAVVVSLLALVVIQIVANKIFPPVPAKPHPVHLANTETNGTNGTNVAAVAATTPTNNVEAATPATNTLQRPPEQIVTLSNSSIRVEFTSWGGGIKSIELLKHRGHGLDNTVLLGPAVEPALTLPGLPNDTFTLEQKNPTTVVMHGDGVTKTLTLGPDYLLDGRIDITRPLSPAFSNILINVGTVGPLDSKEPVNYLNVDWQGGPKWSNRDVSKVTKRTKSGENHEAIRAHWVAVKSQYFALILSTPTNVVGVIYSPVTLPLWPDAKTKLAPVGVTADVDVPLTRGTNGSVSCAFTYYAGPKEYDRLLALGQNQEEAMDFGSWMDGYTGIFGLVLLWGLNFFYAIIHSYGIAIILVTVTIKVLFWPIQAKSIKSMKAMQKFQPQIQKLKDKYKDDAARLNQETMKLYRENKINPLAGCLPMFIQLPVLLGFYRLLMCDIALRGAPFLWIKDLSQPDTVTTIAGFPINPLPIVMAVSGVLQTKLTPTTGDAQQAKMMMFMPLLMTMFFYKLAAGLTLYYTLQQLLSILQQWLALRHEKSPAPALVTGKTK